MDERAILQLPLKRNRPERNRSGGLIRLFALAVMKTRQAERQLEEGKPSDFSSASGAGAKVEVGSVLPWLQRLPAEARPPGAVHTCVAVISRLISRLRPSVFPSGGEGKRIQRCCSKRGAVVLLSRSQLC